VTPKDVWVVSELYYPEETSTGHLLTGIAEGLARRFRTGAVCARPTYASRKRSVPLRETHNGVEILRCRATRLDPHNLLSRMVNIVTITASMSFGLLRMLRRRQIVIVVTNPPTLPFATLLACRLRGARCVLLVHDVFPDALDAAGMTRRNSVPYRLMDFVSRRLYRAMDHVIVIGRDMRRIVEEKRGGPEAITVIPNWGDVDSVHPGDAAAKERFGLAGRFVVQYGGNMGRSHDLDIIVAAAEKLRGEPEVVFMIFGWGVRREALEAEIAARGLDNIRLLGMVPRGEVSEWLAAGDVGLVSMIPGMAGVSVPSRMYNMLAAGQPIIAVTDAGAELAEMIREEAVGWVVPTRDADGLVAAIRDAGSDAARLAEMRRRARAVAEAKYTRAHVDEAYAALMSRLQEER
jgi:colanic acid biosynthesis glycosyl transferase WcaI